MTPSSPGGCVCAPFEYLARRVVKEGDGELEVRRKRMLLATSLTTIMMMSVILLGGGYVPAASVTMLAINIFLFVYLFWADCIRDNVFEIYVLVMCICTLCIDLKSAARGANRDWPIFVVYLDLLLICKVRKGSTYRVLGLLTVWILATQGEFAIRYGLFKVWFVDDGDLGERCSCGDPPCVKSFAFEWGAALPMLFVVFLDFHITRGFANRVEEEKAKMSASVEAAKEIATSLASFDLPSALTALSHNPTLPPDLHAAFQTLVANLASYRPFLPATLFERHDRTTDLPAAIPPPGFDTNVVTIVFTDIKSSTALWEAASHTMQKALQIHNSVMRRCAALHTGYEVKTIGDAFMLAFDSTQAACTFAVEAQLDLLEAEWPEELFDFPLCACDDEGPWRGLRVRTGMNTGEVSIEVNGLTGRVDYLGSAVNKAARIEAKCLPGTAALPLETLENVTVKSDWHLTALGAFKLAGISEECDIYTLVAQDLRDRCATHTSEPTSSSRTQQPTAEMQSQFLLGEDAVATTGVVRYPVEKSLSHSGDIVATLLSICTRTNGIVLSVVGSVVVMSWNCVRPCASHWESGHRFSSFLRGTPAFDTCRPHVGLATGNIAYNVVGSAGQKFTTVVGPPVSLALDLAASGMSLGAYCLFCIYPTTPPDVLQTVRTFQADNGRPLGTCKVQLDTLEIYELRVDASSATDLVCMSLSTLPHTWGPAYQEAYDNEQTQDIRGMAEACGDIVLRNAARIVSQTGELLPNLVL